MKNSRLLFELELTHEQTTLQKMSEEVFGIEVKYFDGAPNNELYEKDLLEWILATEKIQKEVHCTLAKEIQQ